MTKSKRSKNVNWPMYEQFKEDHAFDSCWLTKHLLGTTLMASRDPHHILGHFKFVCPDGEVIWGEEFLFVLNRHPHNQCKGLLKGETEIMLLKIWAKKFPAKKRLLYIVRPELRTIIK